MDRRRALALVAAVALMAAVAAGCAPQSKTSASSTSTPTSSTTSAVAGAEKAASPETTKATGPKADFIAAADALCQASSDRMDAGFANLTANATDEEFAAFVRNTLVPDWKATLGQLRALAPPPSDAAAVHQFFDDLAAGYDAVGQDPLGSFRTDDPLASVNQAMADYGFQVCGGSMDTAG